MLVGKQGGTVANLGKRRFGTVGSALAISGVLGEQVARTVFPSAVTIILYGGGHVRKEENSARRKKGSKWREVSRRAEFDSVKRESGEPGDGGGGVTVR